MIYPSQYRSVDPWIEQRWSSSVNKFSRILTGGMDVILGFTDNSFTMTKHSSTVVRIGPGFCIKDDVLIHVTSTSDVDITVADNFIDSSVLADGYYVLVLGYTYLRTIPFPKASYSLFKSTDTYLTNKADYIFLGTVQIASGTISNVYEYYPGRTDIFRPYPKTTINEIDGEWID